MRRVLDRSHVTVPSVPLSPSAPMGVASLVFLSKVFGCISLGAIDCGQTYVVLNDTRHCKDKMAHTHMINGRWYLTSSEHVDELLQAMG